MASSPSGDNTVTIWLAGLKAGEADAARNLWKHYSQALIGLARQRLPKTSRGAADEEDVAQSVFASLCRGAAQGRFDELHNRDDLWWLLLAMTQRKAASQVRRDNAEKRGAAKTLRASEVASPDASDSFRFEALISAEPTPEHLAILSEQYDILLKLLRDDQLRRVAILRIEGYSVSELSQKIGIGTRSIERKLRLIRTTWSKELGAVSS